MRYKYTDTLSQDFDTGDFIAPDILSSVDANVRAVCAEALAKGGLKGGRGGKGGRLEPGGDLDFGEPSMETAPVLEDIVVDIPPIARVNRDMMKVRFDTFTFSEKFRTRRRGIIIIAVIVVVIFLLLIYLLYL